MGVEGGRGRRVAQVLVAGLAAGLMVACGPEDPNAAGNGKDPSSAPGSASPSQKPSGGPSGKPSTAPSRPGDVDKPGSPGAPGKEPAGPGGDGSHVPPLTCEQLQNAQLQGGSVTLPYGAQGAALTDGRTEIDGVLTELQPQCAIGDVTGDSAHDAVGVVKISSGGTGKFYALVVWRNQGGTAVPAAALELGDRTPVQSVSVDSASRRATVVYLTRGDDDPMVIVTITRTAVFRVAEPTLIEESHTDTPYTP